MQNPNVSKTTTIDPDSMAETVIFERKEEIDTGVEIYNKNWHKPNAAHHIVAVYSEKSRAIVASLHEYGIDLNSPANGVFLPYQQKIRRD